jgi:hypothetical protein
MTRNCPKCWAVMNTEGGRCGRCHAEYLRWMYAPERKAMATQTTLPSDLLRHPNTESKPLTKLEKVAIKDARELIDWMIRSLHVRGCGKVPMEDMGPWQENAIRYLEEVSS